MDTAEPSIAALNRAIGLAGSQSEIARICGVTQPAVSLWIKRRRPVPAEHVLKIEAATGVSCHHLRPDIYPVGAPHAPPAWHGVDGGESHNHFQNHHISQRDNDLEVTP